MKASPSRPLNVFISYSLGDIQYVERLQIHLAGLARNGHVVLWSEKNIAPGAVWQTEKDLAIARADVAVLFVSADFLAAPLIAENELPRLLAAASTSGTLLLPVILSPCGYEDSALAPLKPVNDPAFPLSKMTAHQKEKVWEQVAERIRNLSFLPHTSSANMPDQSVPPVDESARKREVRTDERPPAMTPSSGQLADDVLAEVQKAWLFEHQQAADPSQPRPSLFTNGLCRGHVIQPSSSHYFVAHGFDAATLADWRAAIVDAIAQARSSPTPLTPYFAGDTILSGFRLCSICEKLYTADFSLFLLSGEENLNVYLELGIAIGLGKPFFLIQDRDTSLPPFLEGLGMYTRRGSFVTMRKELASQVKDYQFGAVRFIQPTPPISSQETYFIGTGEDNEDFEWSVTQALDAAYTHHLKPVTLSTLTKDGYEPGLLLKQLVETLQAARFALYRVDEESSAATFLALGISIGLSRPFLMLRRTRKTVPFDLRGITLYEFPDFQTLAKHLASKNQTFFDRQFL